MSTEIATRDDWGPAMEKLTERRRAFVMAYCHQTGRPNASAAYVTAGFTAANSNVAKVEGHRLLHNVDVRAAILEYATMIVSTAGVVIATSALMEEAANPQSQQRVKAADSILGRWGTPVKTEHKVTTETIDANDSATLAKLKTLAAKLGVPLERLIGERLGGTIIDVTPTDPMAGLQDLFRK